MKLRALLLLGLCVAAGQACAGLFTDEETPKQIQQLDARTAKLEEKLDQGRLEKLEDAIKQQARAMIDLQAQIEAQSAELRRLRGQNEELVHSLQDAEKRQKDFYIDLDTRLRHFETAETAIQASPPAPQADKVAGGKAVVEDSLVAENRAYEAAYTLFKTGSHQKAIAAFQEFLRKYPASVYVPNANYETGSAYFALKDYKGALASYQLVVNKYGFSPKAAEAMLGVADCQEVLDDVASAKKTLKQIIAKYPGSETASAARKRLATLK